MTQKHAGRSISAGTVIRNCCLLQQVTTAIGMLQQLPLQQQQIASLTVWLRKSFDKGRAPPASKKQKQHGHRDPA